MTEPPPHQSYKYSDDNAVYIMEMGGHLHKWVSLSENLPISNVDILKIRNRTTKPEDIWEICLLDALTLRMSLMNPCLPNSAWLLSCSSWRKRQKSSTAGFRMSRVFRGASEWCSLAVWRGIITGLQACKSQLERRLASCLAVWPPVCGWEHTLHIFDRLAVLIGQLWMDWHKRV